MDHFAGLDVSVKTTSICIVDDAGKVVREVKVTSEPEALLAVLKNPTYHADIEAISNKDDAGIKRNRPQRLCDWFVCWSRAEKERIVAAAMEPDAVASEVARAAGIQ